MEDEEVDLWRVQHHTVKLSAATTNTTPNATPSAVAALSPSSAAVVTLTAVVKVVAIVTLYSVCDEFIVTKRVVNPADVVALAKNTFVTLLVTLVKPLVTLVTPLTLAPALLEKVVVATGNERVVGCVLTDDRTEILDG